MKTKTMKNIFFSLLTQIVCIICGFIVPKLFLSNYGSDVYGLVTSITQFVAYITLLESGVGLVTKSVLYKAIADKDEKKINSIVHYTQRFFNKIVYVFIIYVIILCLVYPHFRAAQEFDSIFTISLIIIISFSAVFEYFIGITYKLYLQADQKTYVVSYIQIITYIINTILIVLLVNLKCDIRFVKFISSLTFIARPLIQKLYIKHKLKRNFLNYDKNYRLENQKNGLSQHIAGVINNNVDVSLLTMFTPVVNISIYSVYNLIVGQLKTLINGFAVGTDAFFGDLYAKKNKEKLNKYFDAYETIFLIIITVIYSCCSILIVPFVSIYTSDINDANYIQKSFAFLLVITTHISTIKSLYNSITYNAGKFKETEKGAWIEVLINIIISVIMVKKYGLIGVLIGTLCATIFRGLEFWLFSFKNIFEKSCLNSLKKIILSLLLNVLFYIFGYSFIESNVSSYYLWIMYAAVGFSVISLITIVCNFIINYKEIMRTIELVKEVKK